MKLSRRVLLQGMACLTVGAVASHVSGAAVAEGVTGVDFPIDGVGRSVRLVDSAESVRLVDAVSDFLRLSSLDLDDVYPLGFVKTGDVGSGLDGVEYVAAVCVSAGALDRGLLDGLVDSDRLVARAVAQHHGVVWGGEFAEDATGVFLVARQGRSSVPTHREGLRHIEIDID